MLTGFLVLGWSYMRDIKEAKGRKSRKIYPLDREGLKHWTHNFKYKWAKDRLDKEDPNFTKFMIKKERAAVHH